MEMLWLVALGIMLAGWLLTQCASSMTQGQRLCARSALAASLFTGIAGVYVMLGTDTAEGLVGAFALMVAGVSGLMVWFAWWYVRGWEQRE